MRLLVVLLACLTLTAASPPPRIFGVWVLDQRHSRIANADAPSAVAIRVEAVSAESVRILQVTTDGIGGQRLGIRERTIQQPTSKSRTVIMLPQDSVGSVERWTLDKHGKLRIEAGAGNSTGTPQDELVFRPARRRLMK